MKVGDNMKKEKIDKLASFEVLKFFYSNRALTDYLQTLTDEELEETYYSIVVDDIDDVKAAILDCVIQEKEYRADARLLNNEDNKKVNK
jgi:hypothetical protein